MRRLKYLWGRLRCVLGWHDDWLVGNVHVSYAQTDRDEYVVTRCSRDDCWRVRFL
jgi:hypothetical protein